jgi:probable rRNA maturation factor
MSPSILVHNRQRAIKIDIAGLQTFAERALELSLKSRAQGAHPSKLSHIDVILVSDRRMSELHRRFLQLDGPTDVLTFHHGEIFISVETARRQAGAFRSALLREIQLYLVHGLLHLRGFDDKVPFKANVMRTLQERITRMVATTALSRR